MLIVHQLDCVILWLTLLVSFRLRDSRELKAQRSHAHIKVCTRLSVMVVTPSDDTLDPRNIILWARSRLIPGPYSLAMHKIQNHDGVTSGWRDI